MAKADALCASLPSSASLNEIGSADTGSYVLSVNFSPDGTKIVSGLSSGMLKVWDSGGFGRLKPARMANSDRSCLRMQPRWSLRPRMPMRTATRSPQWTSHQTERLSCPAVMTRRSKSGIRVRTAQFDHPSAKNDCSCPPAQPHWS